MRGGARPGSGRPKGSGTSAQYREMLKPHAKDLIKKVVDLAKEGDMAALRLCLDRLCAPLKASDRAIKIAGLESADGLTEKGELILDFVAKGEITPAEASSLMSSLSSLANITNIDEIERRVSQLEKERESKQTN